MRWVVFLAILLLTMTACNSTDNSEPLVQVATSSAPDEGFVTYRHQSGVFSLRMPRTWIPNNLPDENGLRVEFSQLEGNQSVVRLTVYIVNTGTPMTRDAFLKTANAYLPEDDPAGYQWKAIEPPIDQADGSRRVVGIRTYPTIGPRALNIFMQPNGRYFSVLEADVTDADPATLDSLRAVVNTLRVDQEVLIDQGEVVAGLTYTGNISFDGYYSWEDPDGGFNLTGIVVNNQNTAIEAIRLTGYLFDARGNQLSEETSILTQAVLRPNESAPFRLRFEGGRPTTAVRYEVHAAARIADFAAQDFYGQENFTIERNPVYYNEAGNLVISGQLANNGSRLTKEVRIIVSVFNDQNQVVATQTQFINKDTLLPGEVDSYEVVVYEIGGAPVRYDLTVVGVAE